MTPQRRALERALKDVDARLHGRPTSIELLFERARLLDRLGRLDEARLAYVEILQRDAAHFGALNNLGMLLFAAGRRDEAFTCFNAVVAKHPRNPIGHANLGLVLLRGGEAQLAREHYELAVQLDPANAENRRGLALALEALGDASTAREHREMGFAGQPLMELPYRGEGVPIRVLLLVSSGPGNVPADRFLDDRVFAVSKLIAEYYDESVTLPQCDVAFNAIGDADVAQTALRAACAVVDRLRIPTINVPAAVATTGRADNGARLAGIAGAVVPRNVKLARRSLTGSDAVERLAARGLSFPLLLRSPGFHTGMHFERVETAADLAAVAVGLPGEELLAIEYVDTRGFDGNVRKYRAMFVGGAIYPLHLAISARWKVHYFSADMADNARHRAEEEAYLSDMAAHLGPSVIGALQEVERRLGLDYAGVDFTVDAAGNAVIFEANATMIVPVAEEDPRWAYRRRSIERIEAAVRAMLLAKTTQLRPA
ncbi:MAG TPA: tetratricopeptide repeat protein [Candidatus Baltobacteraceae bacterium]|nr:tetratricopeptide repeat protein [Candidatus Baltobacteraceae bacterium]